MLVVWCGVVWCGVVRGCRCNSWEDSLESGVLPRWQTVVPLYPTVLRCTVHYSPASPSISWCPSSLASPESLACDRDLGDISCLTGLSSPLQSSDQIPSAQPRRWPWCPRSPPGGWWWLVLHSAPYWLGWRLCQRYLASQSCPPGRAQHSHRATEHLSVSF